MKKLRPDVLFSIFSLLAMACGTGGPGDAPRSSRVSRAALNGGDYITIDFPGSNINEVNDVNDNGDVVGSYVTPADGIRHGLLRDSKGNFTSFDFPGAIFTSAKGINLQGDIVGRFIAADGSGHGYLLRGGEFTQIDFSDTTSTFPTGIDNAGNIIGGYCFLPCNVGDINGRGSHGFFLDHCENRFVTYDVPDSTSSALFHLDGFGRFVGFYKDANDVPHGFVLINGAFSSVDVPGAVGTWGFGINSSGEVVGSWCDANPCTLSQVHNHAFKLGQGGFDLFDFPGAATTRAWGINSRGDIAGAYRDPTINHGFLFLQ
jgi:uncharacterized membrane protein